LTGGIGIINYKGRSSGTGIGQSKLAGIT
jgi:hypothetical protein